MAINLNLAKIYSYATDAGRAYLIYGGSFITPIIQSSKQQSIIPTKSLTLDSTSTSNKFIASNSTTMISTQAIYITQGGLYKGSSLSENFIINSSGNVTISGGSGADIYTLLPHASTTTTITDFDIKSDRINLSSFNILNFEELNITVGSIIINLEENQKMMLLNLTPADINLNNFIFNSVPNFAPTSFPSSIENNQVISDDSGINAVILGLSVATITIAGAICCWQYNKYCTDNNKIYADNFYI